ncbi:immunoglobulin lambda-1 light chain-like [Cyprinodon tularosa]|uniref:immunoglobulin lambda-1 light chain-like n=1 Tax=Cyprinodon tularosa TaxID=77115 RepID=UPI0018E208DC|nr:immunoglobulin lambda-1 light chain-like [Cyprinodon tularosa]
MNIMLFLPAAALCCLCSGLVAMATELVQDRLSVVAKAKTTVSLKCSGTDNCEKKQVYWYQKTEKDPFRAVLRIDLTDGNVNNRYSHPNKDDFTATKEKYGCTLVIKEVKVEHEGTYFCVCWKASGGSADKKYLIFGTGTKLNITDDKAKPPKVSLYSVAPELQQEGKQPLLCVASGMFPTDVQFSWKRKKAGSQEEPLPDEEQLEIKESDRIASLRLVDRDPDSPYNYTCNVKHELKTEDLEPIVITQALPAHTASSSNWYRERLFCLLYSVLIAKSLVYFCGISLFSIY